MENHTNKSSLVKLAIVLVLFLPAIMECSMANPLETIKQGICALNPFKKKIAENPAKPSGELDKGVKALKGKTDKQKALDAAMEE